MSEPETSAGAEGAPTPATDPRTFVARLFGRLLLRELDAESLAELRAPDVAGALAEAGVTLPESDDLDELGAEFFQTVLQPAGRPPLVHSLWREGKYDGDAAVDVRRVAEGLGLQLAAGARGAPPDHLGCLLTLWAELRDRDAEFAGKFASTHLAWVSKSSAPNAGPGFYGDLLRACAALCDEIVRAP